MKNFIDYLKAQAKYRKKHENPNNLCLMKIQHEIAKENGYRSWGELIKKERVKNENKKEV